MTFPAHASSNDSSWRSHDQEARLLIELLRTSRLTLLYAEAGADKTALLRLGLVPLLSRRAGDRLAPAAVRASGVVVPFPDRRSRSSGHAPKCRREIVVYFDDWTDTPLAALRQALYLATTTATAEQLVPSMRLSQVLAELGNRLDAHLVVLIDRFEDFLEARSQGDGFAQFANELAQAVNSVELQASFLIAVDEAARPRLASLRASIPGFDDFSVKLTPPREFRAPAAPRIVKEAEPAKAAAPVVVESLPLLNEPLAKPSATSPSLPAAIAESTVRAPIARKVKRPPLPLNQVKTEDVYAMIDAALSRITARAVIEARTPGGPDGFASKGDDRSQLPTLSGHPARTGGKDLQKAIERMERRMGAERDLSRDS